MMPRESDTDSRVSPPQAFCAIGFLFGLNEVARDLEDPFTTELGYWLGANRLHAPLMQTHFDARLLSLGSEASRAEWPTELSACYARFLDDALDADVAGEAKSSAEVDVAVANGRSKKTACWRPIEHTLEVIHKVL